MPLHRSIRRQPVALVPYLRFIRRSAAGFKSGKHSITGYTGAPLTSVGLFTMSSLRELVFGVRKSSTSPDTPVPYIWTTGACTLALIRGYAKGVEGNPSAPVTPVPLRSMHRCNSARLSQCQIVNGYYLVLV